MSRPYVGSTSVRRRSAHTSVLLGLLLCALFTLVEPVRSEGPVVVNDTFDSNVGGWTLTDPANELAWDARDANGDPHSGSARIVNRAPMPPGEYTATASLTRCVDLEPAAGSRMVFSSALHVPGSQKRSGYTSVNLAWFAGNGCDGERLGRDSRSVDGAAGKWERRFILSTVPDAARSAELRIDAVKVSANSAHDPSAPFELLVDDVFLCPPQLNPHGSGLALPMVGRGEPILNPGVPTGSIDANAQLAYLSGREGGPPYSLMATDPTSGSSTMLHSAVNTADWSPANRKFAYTVQRSDGTAIGSADPATGDKRVLVEWPGNRYLAPRWSPDGKWLVFVGGILGDERLDVFVADSEGSNLVQLTTPDQWMDYQDYLVGIRWSPDSRRLVFAAGPKSSQYTQLGYAIFVANTAGQVRAVTEATPEVAVRNPTWSPEGSRIFFDRSSGAGREIYSVSFDGDAPVRLTNLQTEWTTSVFGAVSFSDDGRRAAFVVFGPDGLALHFMNSDGSGQFQLPLNWGVTTYAPTWSPDSKSVAVGVWEFDRSSSGQPPPSLYASSSRVPGNVYVVDVARQQARLVATGVDLSLPAAWSPGGSYLAFASDMTCPFSEIPRFDLYLYEVRADVIRPLTNGCGDDLSSRNPIWMTK